MSSSETAAASPSCQTLLQSFLQIDGLPFAEILTEQDCQSLFCQHGLASDGAATPLANDGTPPAALPEPTGAAPAALPEPTGAAPAALPEPTGVAPARRRPTAAVCPLWTPWLTLWTLLHQVLSPAKACTAAVKRAIVLLTELGGELCSENPGGYSKARGRLPQGLIQDLTMLLGPRLEAASPAAWRWLGHRVLLVDGWVVSLPDSAANQQAYPQPKSQKKGLGFPQVRLVGMFGLASQALVAVHWGPCQGKRTGETALLRDLFDHLRPGDVLVADRYYCSYFMIALLKRRGVDVVFHLHQRRKYSFGKGQALGAEDEVVVWPKPKQCPEWLTAENYAALPQTLEVRMVGVAVHQPGFRVQHYVIATTLLNAANYSQAAVASLYKNRWEVEGMIRSLKTYMQMEMLRCRTPAMIDKEIWAYLLGYNLTRKIMAQAALRHGFQPWQISFTQTLESLDSYRNTLAKATPAAALRVAEQVLLGLTKMRVGQRPDRVEPRRQKRRPKPFGYLTKPRQEARAEILNRPGGEPRRKGQRRSSAAVTEPAATASGPVP